MTDTTFNGWTNYETWNVALYIQNEYAIYSLAREWVAEEHGQANTADYWRFSCTLRELCGEGTPDGVEWNHPALDLDELTEMLQDL